MLKISNNVYLYANEIKISAIRASGPGGQNVNKVSSAIHLSFDIHASSLPEIYKTRLMDLSDNRVSSSGVITIKAQRYKSQSQNRDDALLRLQVLLKTVATTAKKRRKSKPSKNARKKRVDTKVKRGKLKSMRNKKIID